jgi:hypothetical protein
MGNDDGDMERLNPGEGFVERLGETWRRKSVSRKVTPVPKIRDRYVDLSDNHGLMGGGPLISAFSSAPLPAAGGGVTSVVLLAGVGAGAVSQAAIGRTHAIAKAQKSNFEGRII